MLRFLEVIFFLVFLPTIMWGQNISTDSITWSLDIPDVVVTAQYAPTDSRSALHPIRSIKLETIRQRGANNLEQLLNQELNVRISQDLILGSSLSLQGISGQNVKIMVDGVPVVGRVGDNIDLSQINLSQIERIEIVEGPLSVNYGTDALGGVINLISKKSQLNRFETGVCGQWESAGWRNWSAKIGARLSPKWLVQLDGGSNEFAGFDADTTRDQLWNPKRNYFADAMLRHDFNDDKSLRYAFNWFDETVEDLGDVRRPQFKPYAFDDHYLTRRSGHSLHFDGKISSNWHFNALAGYNEYRRLKESFRLDFETDEKKGLPTQQDTMRYDGLVFRAVAASAFPDKKWNYQIGVDMNYETAAGTRLANEGRANAGDFAAFGSLNYKPFPELAMQLGARAAWNTRFAAPVVPSFNFLWKHNPSLSVRGSYARGFRSPSLKELFFNFVDVNHFIVGNPALEAENSDHFQLAFKVEKERKPVGFESSFTFFYNDIRQKIDLYTFGEDNGKLQYSYFNRVRFKTVGATWRNDFKYRNWSLKIGVAPTGRYNLLSENNSAVEPFTFSTELNGELGWRLPKQDFSVNFFARYNDRLLRFYAETAADGSETVAERWENGFAMLDFSASKYFWKKRLHLVAGAKNLLDVTNIAAGGADASTGPHNGGGDSVPVSIGRSYFLRLSWNFGFGN